MEDRTGQVGYAPAAFLMVILDTTAEEEESSATKKGQDNSTEENQIGGWVGQEGERRKSYSAAMIDGIKRNSRIYVGDYSSEDRYKIEQGRGRSSVSVCDIVARHGMQYHCYADDIQIYATVGRDQCIAAALLKIEACVVEVADWMVRNQLKLNKDKSQAIIFHTVKQSPHVPVDTYVNRSSDDSDTRLQEEPGESSWK